MGIIKDIIDAVTEGGEELKKHGFIQVCKK